MDTYNSDEISVEHFRLRSVRRRERAKRTDFEKKLIRLYREERALRKEMDSLGYERLDPPIQRGFKRSFVLRDDIARSDDSKFFQGILDKINTVQYSWKKDFKQMRRHRGRKIYEVREQELERFGTSEMKKKQFSESEKKYFLQMIVPKGKPGESLWLYTFTEPWRFRLKVEANMMTRTRIKDFDLARRAREVDSYLERNHLRPKTFRIVHGRYQWRLRYDYNGDLPRYCWHPFKNRSFADILYEYMLERESHTVNFKPSTSEGLFFLRSIIKTERCNWLVCQAVGYLHGNAPGRFNRDRLYNELSILTLIFAS
jgi:hypothetical protein